MKISQAAFDLTVAEEVTSKAYYERHYTRPEWPGLSSGVTVGIGYDLGQASHVKITLDWSGKVSSEMLQVMLSCAGITGSAAKTKCAAVHSQIMIPWDRAIAVFAERDVPQWTATVIKAVPGSNLLTPSCLGVLFDIAYNRGAAGFNSNVDRYREMVAIRDDVKANKLSAVSIELYSMKRLWPNTSGLLRRCDHRVTLWEAGLLEKPSTAEEANVGPTPPKPDPDIPINAGPARTKPPATTTAQNGTTGAIVVGSVTAAHQSGLSLANVLLIGIFATVVAGVVWWLWWRNRNPT